MLSALACNRELQSWGGEGVGREFTTPNPTPKIFKYMTPIPMHLRASYDSRVQLVLGLEKFNINNSLTVAK